MRKMIFLGTNVLLGYRDRERKGIYKETEGGGTKNVYCLYQVETVNYNLR